jgi:phosphoribosyl 1,2-cyclic phosphate phosphodiesterase
MGVPTIGCDCRVCHSCDPHDRRTRPSILLAYDGRQILIDTTPDFREQALREGLTQLDAVLYTHAHADHILGLDDLRPLSFHRSEGKIPLYAEEGAGETIRSVFRYIFDATYKYGGLAQVELRSITRPLTLFGASFEPVTVLHGDAEILGFRFGSAAYVTDFSEIPAASMDRLRDLDVLFLDALRHRPHRTHSTVENSLRIAAELQARRVFFTHICHELAHEETNAALPPHVRLSYDGMKVEFDIA